ncbi:thyroid adenoma-associated protein [Podospora fimiseda]|uniref:Thyroid adenoma-associated protein n=1 Tax=Podospora fimiseda TaxID=252190 RepID=A0AAN7GV48_9PEZI|nr:thyroid adenoma-associated protein [Podospora fimiseda]
MDSAPPQQTLDTNVDTILTGLRSDVFENANTITKWLLNQPEESRPQLAQGLFQKLIQDASQSRQYHANGHACVKLCSFVQQCAKSPDQALKEWASTESLTLELFQFYLEWYEHDPHRALRLVLDVLVASSTNNPNPETGRTIKKRILETLVSIVSRKYPKQLTKSGLQCLDHLFSKKVISLDDVALAYKELEPLVVDVPALALWKSFAFHLFSWMELTYICPLSGKCLVHIFRALDGTDGFTVGLWRQWLQEALIQEPDVLEDIKNYVLVPIFKTDKAAALRLLEEFNSSQPLTVIDQELSDQGILLQLATLELGKKFGLVEEPQSSLTDTQISLQETVLDSLLGHHSISVRSSAFSLLVLSQATTKPFSEVAFNLLKKHLAAFHADYDAKVRNEVLGLTKSLLRRAKNVITVAERSLTEFNNRSATGPPPKKKKAGPEAAPRDASEAKDILERHTAFIKWYLNFLKSELVPTASYQRHITAAKAALLTLRVGKHAGATDDTIDEDIVSTIASDSTWIRLLLDLLLDPFDDVREASSTLLGLIPQELVAAPTSSSTTLLQVLQEFCDRAAKLADRTGRADHGDGAARSQGLLCSWLDSQDSKIGHLSKIVEGIEGKIAKAEHDLGHAAIENPVHADFAAISYVWQVLAKDVYPEPQVQMLAQIQRRILACAQRIWKTVKHVLCDDSPEGHLPEEMEDIEGLDTKDLLSYSFRAVHESSNLLRLVMGTLRLKVSPGVPFPPLDVFRDTGFLTFEQLASLRHRGAFSTVSYTFMNCCQITQNLRTVFSEAADSDNLLREWYQGAINCIMTQASTTRRSAGIPSLIAAVLSANASSPSFDEVFCNLEEIGKKPVRQAETDGSNLPQVHALNCLREIFRSSLLSKRAEGYLARTLLLAGTCLKSEVWAIRNCGLLLLRSLIDCLLGTGESKALIESGWDGTSVRISYNKYPTLPGVILGLLKSVSIDENVGQVLNSAAAEAVFPALDIIRRAGPPEENRDELREHIETYLGSRIWHVREIAARTLCSFLLQTEWASEIGKLLSRCGHSMNQFHGTLLTARFVIERKADLGFDLKSDSASIHLLLDTLADYSERFEKCPEVQAGYLEVLNLLTSLKCLQGTQVTITPEALAKYGNSVSALLKMEVALKVVHETAASGDVAKLRTHLLETLNRDINTANRMLETIPSAWEKTLNPTARSGLCNLYMEVCNTSTAPEARAQSLLNLGALLNTAMLHSDTAELPTLAQLDNLWTNLYKAEINPILSCAIIETSGILMVIYASIYKDTLPDLQQRLRNWGDMILDCLDVDNSFDTRFAAATSLKSFFLAHTPTTWDSTYLPALSALYEALIDDDDEVRELAASASSGPLNAYLIAPTAADSLVAWMSSKFSTKKELISRVIFRMIGQTYSAYSLSLIPAEELLRKAMEFDDSLFAAEEQNLFVDEIRETIRWRRVFIGGENGILTEWVIEGLESILKLIEERGDDGPLGWCSDQHVFAVCARVVLCGVVVGKENEEVKEMLGRLREIGGRLHGSILEMVGDV